MAHRWHLVGVWLSTTRGVGMTGLICQHEWEQRQDYSWRQDVSLIRKQENMI